MACRQKVIAKEARPSDEWQSRCTSATQGRASRGGWEVDDRAEGDIFGGRRTISGGRLLCLLLCGFELAINGDESILIEAGIAFHARFGFFSASKNTEIVLKETDAPFYGGI